MIKKFFLIILFLLPLFSYVCWVALVNRSGWDTSWKKAPRMFLLSVGLLIAATCLVGFTLFDRVDLEGRYLPARIDSGAIIPGQVEEWSR